LNRQLKETIPYFRGKKKERKKEKKKGGSGKTEYSFTSLMTRIPITESQLFSV
jgi:hypothetical protein